MLLKRLYNDEALQKEAWAISDRFWIQNMKIVRGDHSNSIRHLLKRNPRLGERLEAKNRRQEEHAFTWCFIMLSCGSEAKQIQMQQVELVEGKVDF